MWDQQYSQESQSESGKREEKEAQKGEWRKKEEPKGGRKK
jgi:hypothetical protein